MSKKVKIFAIVVLVIAAIIVVISLSGHSASTDNATLTSTNELMPITNTAPNDSSNEFSSLLSTVTSINIDESVFASPTYKALRDHPVVLGSDVAGRVNPFAPIGTDSSADLINPVVQTLHPGKVTGTSAEFSAQITFTTTAPVSVIFQYGTTDQFGSATSPIVITKSGTVLATANGLTPNTTYYVQAVAVVGSTTTNGTIMPFTTAPASTP